MNTIEDKQVLTNMIERQASEYYTEARNMVLQLANQNPATKLIALNYLKANETKWLAKLQEKCDMLVEMAYIDPDITLDQAMKNAEDILNGMVGGFLEEKLNMPLDTINIGLQLLLGKQI